MARAVAGFPAQAQGKSGMRTVIFDLDGTLADTGADLIRAANACFRRAGHGDLLDPAQDKGTAFRGGRAMLRLGYGRLPGVLDEAAIEADYPHLLDVYEAGIDRETRLYPGVVRALRALRRRGCATGICTNKPERLAELLLARLGVRELFDGLVGADTLATRKPDPAPLLEAVRRSGGALGRTLLVGDTLTDRETARNAGVRSVLVTFGPDGDGVASLAPDALLARFADLGAVVDRLLGRD